MRIVPRQTQETDMNNAKTQEFEIGTTTEMPIDDLDAVSGGVPNFYDELYNTVLLGMAKGYRDAGGSVTVTFN